MYNKSENKLVPNLLQRAFDKLLAVSIYERIVFPPSSMDGRFAKCLDAALLITESPTLECLLILAELGVIPLT